MRLLLLVAFAAVASTARGASSLRTSAARAQAHLEAEIKPLAAKYDCHIQQDNLKDTLSDILDKNAARVDRLTQKCSDDLGKEKKDAADERTSTKLVFSTAIAKANETRANQTGLAQAEYNRVVGLAEASLDSARQDTEYADEAKDNETKTFNKAKGTNAADKTMVAQDKVEAGRFKNESNAAAKKLQGEISVEAEALWNTTIKEGKAQRTATEQVCTAEYVSTMALITNDTEHVTALEALVKKLKLCQEGNEATAFVELGDGVAHPCAKHTYAVAAFLETGRKVNGRWLGDIGKAIADQANKAAAAAAKAISDAKARVKAAVNARLIADAKAARDKAAADKAARDKAVAAAAALARKAAADAKAIAEQARVAAVALAAKVAKAAKDQAIAKAAAAAVAAAAKAAADKVRADNEARKAAAAALALKIKNNLAAAKATADKVRAAVVKAAQDAAAKAANVKAARELAEKKARELAEMAAAAAKAVAEAHDAAARKAAAAAKLKADEMEAKAAKEKAEAEAAQRQEEEAARAFAEKLAAEKQAAEEAERRYKAEEETALAKDKAAEAAEAKAEAEAAAAEEKAAAEAAAAEKKAAEQAAADKTAAAAAAAEAAEAERVKLEKEAAVSAVAAEAAKEAAAADKAAEKVAEKVAAEKAEADANKPLQQCGDDAAFVNKESLSSYTAKEHPVTVSTGGSVLVSSSAAYGATTFACVGMAKGAWGVAQAKEIECDAVTAAAATRANMWTPNGDKTLCYFACTACTTDAPATPTTTAEPEVDDGKPVLFNSSSTTVDNKAVMGDVRDMRRRMGEAAEKAENAKTSCMGKASVAFTATADAATAMQTKTNKDAAETFADSVEEAAKNYDAAVTAGLATLDDIEKALEKATEAFNAADAKATQAVAAQGLAKEALANAEVTAAGDQADSNALSLQAYDATTLAAKKAKVKSLLATETALAQALGTINKGCAADKAILENEVGSVEKMQGMMGKLKVAGADAATTAKPEVTPAKA